MAKKQTRRSISVSRTTYEKLKSYCETHGISMSQFVETRVGDFLGRLDTSSASIPRTIETTIEHRPPVSPEPRAPEVEDREERVEGPSRGSTTADQIFTF